MPFYDEIEIEDMTFDPKLQIYHYPCPCGDRFEIAIADLRDGEEVAVCPSCSLMIKVIFEVVSCLLGCYDWIWDLEERLTVVTYSGRFTKRRGSGRTTEGGSCGLMAERQTINIKGLVQEKALRVIRTLRLPDPSCFVNRECHLAAECSACLTDHCKCHTHGATPVGLSTRLAAEERHCGCCGVRGIASEG